MAQKKTPVKTSKKTVRKTPGKSRSVSMQGESAEKYRFLIEATHTGYVILDDRGRVLDANDEYIRMTGHGTLADIRGRVVTEWTAPYDLERNAAEVAQCMQTGSVRNLAIDYIGPTGTVVPVEINATVLQRPGAPRIFTVCRDIAERKRSECTLRDSEVRMRTIVESLPMGMHMYRLEQDGRLVFVGANPAADKILGVDNRMFIGKTIEEAFPPLKDSEVPQRYRDVARSGKSWQTESIEYKDNAIKGAFEVHAFQTAPNTMAAAFEDITARKRSEAALKQSEEKYRRLYNETPILLHSIDRNAVLVDVNEHWLKVMGYERGEVIGRKVMDFYTPAAAAYAREVVQPAFFRDGFVKDVPYQFVKKNGEVIDVLLSATAERDAAGNVVRSQAVSIDITEKKHAEDLLRQSEARYRMLYEGTPVMMHSINAEGKLISVSDQWLKTLGYTRDEVLGRRTTEFLEEASAAYARNVVLPEFMRTGICSDIPYTFVKKSGEHISTLLSAIAERDDAGRMVRSLAVIIDVTERNRAEENLRESEERYRQLFDAESDAIFLIDNEVGRILMANVAAAAMYGYSQDELLDMKNTDLSAEPSETRRVTEGTPVMKDNAVTIPLRYHRKKDGTVFPVEITGRFFTYKDRPVHIAAIRDITERKRAEEALLNSEKMLKTIIDAEPECVKLLDENANLIMMNRAGLDMLQVESLDQVRGQCVCPMVTSEYRQPFLDLTKRVFQGESGTLTFEIVGMKGRHLWLETYAVPLHNEKNEITALLGVTRDVTERRRAEEESRRNEARMSSLYRISQHPAENEQIFLDFALNEAISLTGSAIGYLYSYDEAKREFTLSAYSRDVMKECSVAEKKTCYELDKTGIWGEAVRQRKPILLNEFGSDHPLKKGYPEGHAVLRKFLTVPVIMQGAVVAVVGVANKPVDYTDADVLQLNLLMDSVWKMVQRSRAEHALQMSEERFRNLAESLPLTVFEMDLQGRFTYVNRAALEKFGYSREEVDAGLNMAQVIAPGDRDRAREVMASRLAGNADGYFEYQGLRKNGTTFPVTVASGPIIRDGRPVGLRGIVSDLSERKQLEEELLKSQKLESIGTLAGGIAHDFNNLLQGIFGYISMAKLTIDQREKSLAMLVQAEKALHQSVNLTSQLLTFSKGGKPVKTVLDLRPVIENAVKFALSGSRVSYDLSFGHDLSAAEADEGQLGQVVQNIVLNAEQAMPQGGRIDIAVRNVSPDRAAGLHLAAPDGLIEIVVSDQGIGIPPEHLLRIFDPYFTTKEKGSGLGLATSYSIVKNHNGMIDVSSELGKGTTFTVYLPSTSAAQVPAASSASAPGECATGRTCRVLVMDDEEVVRVVTGELLRELGHEAEYAENGESAVEQYRRAISEGRPFDLVILDLTIRGGMGGVEALRKLQEFDPGVRAVVSSGYSDAAEAADYQAYGFRSFLKKPYNIEQLQDVLNRLTA